MKNTHLPPVSLFTLTAATFLLISGSLSFARDRIGHMHQPPAEGDDVDSGNFGLGFSTIGFYGLQNSSITGMYSISKDNWLQGLFSIPQTSPFNMGAALLFKHTVTSSSHAGFHIGGGFGLASLNSSSLSSAVLGLNFALLGGFHFELPGAPHVLVHLDGGPNFSLNNTSPNAQTNFSLMALSPAFGASVVYLF